MLPFEVLGVDEQATRKEAKRAFVRVASMLAPDLNSPDAEVARRANDALGALVEACQSYGAPTKPEKQVLGALPAGLPPLSRPAGPLAKRFISLMEVSVSSRDVFA